MRIRLVELCGARCGDKGDISDVSVFADDEAAFEAIREVVTAEVVKAHFGSMVTGDVIPARGVNYFATVRHDFLWPFRPTAEYTKNADVTFANLESPLFAGCPVNPNSGFTFCGDARFVNGLTYMGADVVNLANNHTSNYGAEGIKLTEQLLNSQFDALEPPAPDERVLTVVPVDTPAATVDSIIALLWPGQDGDHEAEA